MKRHLILALALSIASQPAFATTCEESFQKKGNMLVRGTTYTASLTIPNLNANHALRQLREIATGRGMRIINTQGNTLFLEEPPNVIHRAFPITVTIAGNQVDITVSLKSGSISNAEIMKSEVCGMLNQLRDRS
ncbi:MAG: hypothetical protein LBL59_12450 [Xanthomonadaceae bacterium]|jgi:hypothetical protein|nr:hypothetical protein [Xanthomonadaceae bacterium]